MSSITNLLASIQGSGQRPAAGSARPASNGASRTGYSGTGRPSPSASRPTERSSASRALPSRPPTKATITRPTPSNGVTKPLNGSARPQPSRPAAASNTSNAAPPKKGSFAEIMQRAQLAQEKMGKVGQIQHKKVDAGMSRKERMEQLEKLKAEHKTASKRSSAAKTRSASTSKERSTPGASSSGKGTSKAKKPPVPEKKVRKAPPSTGYTGTARPSATGSRLKPSGPLGSAILGTGVRRPAARPSRYDDDEEDDMDDFIADEDDEEEPHDYRRPAPRYRYADDYDSDGSSDMEAGLSEIDLEEARAQREAIAADRWEAQQELKRKEEKERRKREAMRGR